LDEKQLAYLRSVDSPTLANAIEQLKLRDRCEGFVGGSIRCQFPDLGVMVGAALTVTMDSKRGAVASRAGYWRMWEELERLERPTVVVIHDASGAPTRCAYFGEVMATIAQRLGAVGVVTDGGVRDVAEVRALGMQYFAPFTVVSHGNFEIVDVGAPVALDGQQIQTGDLLHGDANGVVVLPKTALDRVPEVVNTLRARERATIDFVNTPGFTVEGLKQITGY
jgi:4-hydroxy-4-methyl-2-oxoglutarate aldolase